MEKIGHGLRNALRQGFHDEGSRRAVRRLDEVSSPDVDHTWPWHLSKHHGPLLSHSEYVGAVRVRLGAAGPDEPAPCELCRMLMDSCGSQPACCSIAEETRGHYKFAAQIHASAAQVDSSAELEAEGLIPRTARRPADIRTIALGCRLSALGIGMWSPDAQQAGNDCTATVAARKRDTYVPYMATLERQNIQYEPLIRSSYGRPRPRATLALRALSSRIAGRRLRISQRPAMRSTNACAGPSARGPDLEEGCQAGARLLALCSGHLASRHEEFGGISVPRGGWAARLGLAKDG